MKEHEFYLSIIMKKIKFCIKRNMYLRSFTKINKKIGDIGNKRVKLVFESVHKKLVRILLAIIYS